MMEVMGQAEAFEAHRPLLTAIAYRMLGSQAEAEDVVQEAFLRFRDAEPAAIESPRAWLSTVVTRLCLDHLKSARTRRETYVGPWLPEPVRTDEHVAGRDAESISLAFLVLLESLSPVERAVFLLHEVFDYGHGEIAEILEREEAAVRQIFHRARTHVVARRPRFAPSREDHLRLLGGFMGALTSGDLAGLKSLLAADAVTRTDGGGRVRAARNVVRGADSVARFYLGLLKKGGTHVGIPPGSTFEIADLNGWPSLLVRHDGQVIQALGIETDGQLIHGVYVVLTPDKLSRL
jgi:RNA polymerase sigma-70 factor (ECF subfamily)